MPSYFYFLARKWKSNKASRQYPYCVWEYNKAVSSHPYCVSPRPYCAWE